MTQLVVIVEVLVAERDPEHPHPPFVTLDQFVADLGIPIVSPTPRVGIRGATRAVRA